mmetsp:Transcript_14563/g.27387  ORF Transcript_14563/g.27387 Transcript_14563/m.27387 type:complete len:380 (+) Transcript_14563:424-1563(+)
MKSRDDEEIGQIHSSRRKVLGLLWKIHFFIGLLVLCFGMLCNGGGRKYVSADPLKASMDCQKLYVNVYSISPEDEGAIICCTDHFNHWWNIFSYEGFLCNSKIRSIPLSRSITRFPDSWLLPLVPIALRLLIALFGKLSNRPHPNPHDLWTNTKRFIFHILIFQFRGWGLYVFLNMIEDIVLSSNLVSNHISGSVTTNQMPPDLRSCWYTSWLKDSWYNDIDKTRSCYGLPFDFSDHVVLFFSHSFPSMIFEASFCFLFPFLPVRCSSFTQVVDMDGSTSRRQENNISTVASRSEFSPMAFIWNNLLPIMLLILFLYLNVVTLLAVHSTAAYFHSIGEVIVGYLISLLVQLPVGWIIWADEWRHVRHLVGFPMERQHMD